MMRMRSDGLRTILGATCLGIAALAAMAPAAQATELPTQQINECNSEVTISQTPQTPPDLDVGETVNVTLTVANIDARDGADVPIPQAFDMLLYTGDCVTPPGLPCTANMPASVMYLGNVGGTCAGVTPNPMGNGVIEFDFIPALVLGPGPESCTVTFDVVYSAATDYAAQANLAGTCQMGAFNSDTTVTTVITVVAPVVPTLSEVALLILALVLAGGSWIILRRNRVSVS